MQTLIGYVKTKAIKQYGNVKYVAVLIGGKPVIDANGDPIIRDTRKQVQDFIKVNWHELRYYN